MNLLLRAPLADARGHDAVESEFAQDEQFGLGMFRVEELQRFEDFKVVLVLDLHCGDAQRLGGSLLNGRRQQRHVAKNRQQSKQGSGCAQLDTLRLHRGPRRRRHENEADAKHTRPVNQ